RMTMKSRTSSLAIIMMLQLVSPWICFAQQPSANTDELKRKAAKADSIDVIGKSDAIQRSQKQTRLSAYRELQVALQEDIKALEAMRDALPANDKAMQRKIDDQIA